LASNLKSKKLIEFVFQDLPELRRASLSTGHSHNLHNSNNSLTVDSSSSNARPKSPTLLQMVSNYFCGNSTDTIGKFFDGQSLKMLKIHE